jgi:acetylornithine deacetylase/succinyl-diaminopimelate desuccinylase-like protein
MARFPANVVKLLEDLVSCPSVQPEGEAGGSKPGEEAMAQTVAGLLRALGADVELQRVAPGRPNVVAVFEPRRKARATVAFAPHLDTVGVGGMTVPPFALTKKGGRLHGRGACDTKGPTAALFWALRRWLGTSSARDRDLRVVVAVTAGEEQGSLGASALVRAGFKADFAVALEPTQLKVVHAAKGVLRVWIETTGRSVHGSQPDRGVNAIYRALPLAVALEGEGQAALQRRRHPLLGPATLSLGVMAGGRDINIVPSSCRMALDLRTHPGCQANEVLALLKKLRTRHAPTAKLSVLRTGPAFETDRGNPWARKLRAAGKGWAVANWFCDANILAAHGIPAVAFGPGNIAQAHTRDEFITVRDLEGGVGAFGRFLASVSKA